MTAPADEERVLILAPRGRDAQVAEQVLDRAGTRAEACPDISGWLACLQAGAGAALVTEEALGEGRTDDLFAWLDAQPPWSDFPFVILLGKLFVAPIAIPIAVAFYIFEWGLVASLQAYIFAMLSGIYIGSAIEPHH